MTKTRAKTARRSMWYRGGVRLEGNNGGDYIELTRYDPERQTVRLKAGHCCVVQVDHVVPVELLTCIIGRLVAEHGDIETVAKKYLDYYTDKSWSESRRRLIKSARHRLLDESEGAWLRKLAETRYTELLKD